MTNAHETPCKVKTDTEPATKKARRDKPKLHYFDFLRICYSAAVNRSFLLDHGTNNVIIYVVSLMHAMALDNMKKKTKKCRPAGIGQMR